MFRLCTRTYCRSAPVKVNQKRIHSDATCLKSEFCKKKKGLPSSYSGKNGQGWGSGREGKDCGGKWT